MAEHVYECMFIFNANTFNRDPNGAAASIEKMVETIGGEILASRLFEERKFAYPIRGYRKGAYWLTYIKMEGEMVTKLNRAAQLNDSILRHLFVKIDPRLVDHMVAVAQGKVPVEAVYDDEDEADSEESGEKSEAVANT